MAMLMAAVGCSHSNTLKITDMGAVGDGIIDNAEVINAALDSCCRRGGGTVVIPAGRFLSGTIYMKPGVALELTEGAELVASPALSSYGHYVPGENLSRYDSGVGTRNQNCASDTVWTQAFIIACNADGAKITGCGRIDGGHIVNAFGEEGMRGPHTILVAETDGFEISGISIDRASNYAILGYELEHCRFSGLTITQGWDGIHIRGGRDIRISDCDLATGDDCIAGGWWKDFVIEDCRLNSSCNGIRMIMPSEDFLVKGCTFKGPGRFPHRTSSDRGGNMLFAINIEPGAWGEASGDLSGIRVKDCSADSVLSPFSLTLLDGQHCSDVSIDGYRAEHCWRMAFSVKSWEYAVIDNVDISNSSFSFVGIPEPGLEKKILSMPKNQWPYFPSYGAYFRNVGTVTLKNVSFTVEGPDDRPDVLTENVSRFLRK